VVFCGYGEPLLRFELVKKVAEWIKQNGGKVRINTNGHGNLINKKNILPELERLVDNISVSLNAQDEDTYDRICKPTFANAFQEVISFIRKARTYVPEVSITVVTHEGVDIEKCRKIANDLGVQFRVRNLDLVG
jgi:TatD DNase family protein